MLQDEVVFVLTKGLSTEFVLALDLAAFRSLFESLKRLDAQEKMEMAWTMMTAAQATGKDMSELLKKLGHDKTARLVPEGQKSDLTAFKRAFGGKGGL